MVQSPIHFKPARLLSTNNNPTSDFIDTLNPSDAKPWNKGCADGHGLTGDTNIAVDRQFNKKQAEAKMMLELLAIDREEAILLMDYMARWFKRGSGSRLLSEFKSFDEFLPFRYEDAAAPFYLEFCRFAMGAKVSEEQRQDVDHITRPVMTAMVLANDYYSFDKEYDEYLSVPGSEEPRNSICLLMKQHEKTLSEARLFLKQKMIELEQEYSSNRQDYEATHPDMPTDLKKFLDAAEFAGSGAVYWCCVCPRYNDFVPFKKQLGMGLDGDESSVDNNDEQPDDPPANRGDTPNEAMLNDISAQPSNANHFTEVRHEKVLDKIVLSPYDYLKCLPSKGVRSIAIDGLNFWLRVPDTSLAAIKSITNLLHSSSLMLDDIEDGSLLRRGKPATHTVFGVPQTINSANYLFAVSLKEVQKLSSDSAHEIFANELCNLHLGQSLDLYWTFHVQCPSESEYIAMVDNKTGGLFRLLGLLMQTEGSVTNTLDLRNFTTIVGRYFQIRDDYFNLCSPDYTTHKGFCEDLDEGKFSLPLIHMLNHTERKDQAWSILQERRRVGSMPFETKKLILEIMEECGSLEYTREILRRSEQLVDKEIGRLEQLMESPNFVMRLLVEKLRLVV
ncbi:hypothetical protein MBLNU13_g09550t2 [Cladosporium sp. NU13]